MVILVGWGVGAKPSWTPTHIYKQAAANTATIGNFVGKMAQKIKSNHPNVKIYGIGFSLGAHVMGFAGRTSSGSFDRITGLDPAGPCFQDGKNTDKHIQKSDATLVDIIHTDGTSGAFPLGTLELRGHLDFYPFGGYSQPGCILSPCNHFKAHRYFIASIKEPQKFETNRLTFGDSNTQGGITVNYKACMGYHADDKKYAHEGSFYLNIENAKDL